MKLVTFINFYLLLFGLAVVEVSSLRKDRRKPNENIEVQDDTLDGKINLDVDRNITVHLNNQEDENSLVINKKFCDFNKMKTKIKFTGFNQSSLNQTNKTVNLINSTNTALKESTINSTHLDISDHKTNSSITSDDLLSIIADQTENIKNEICFSCLEINTSLNILIDEIKMIKKTLKQLETGNPSSKEVYSQISNCINNLNLIKADLFKLNEILDTLQKANCKNFMENSKKYTLVVNSSNKILEKIQSVLRKFKININLVVLN
jgi:hypothetical protein